MSTATIAATPARSVVDSSFRERLELRRERLVTALPNAPEPALLEGLLEQVDAALERVADGRFGRCETCGDSVEVERLAADPLLRFCLDHLSRAERRALEHDLETAARVQGALLPRRDLAAGGWEAHLEYCPAGPVGGDFCDLLPGDGDAAPLSFVFGDVSGKGVAASLLVAHLHALFRSLLATSRPLPELMADANHLFSQSTPASHYATAVVGRLGADGAVELANAGHPPVLLRTRNGAVRRLCSGGLPVGMFAEVSFRAERLRLAPGDTLLLYTDGVSEAREESRDGDGGEYGVERLARTLARLGDLSAGEVAAACLDDLHGNGHRAADDLTLLAVRRTGG